MGTFLAIQTGMNLFVVIRVVISVVIRVVCSVGIRLLT